MALTEQQQLQVDHLKRLIGEHDYSDDDLYGLLSADGATENTVAAHIWTEKAATSADWATMQEGSSRRQIGDLHKQALSMAAYYGSLGGSATDPTSATRRSRSRAIVRP